MEKQRPRILIMKLPPREKKNSECIYCGIEYLRKEYFEDGLPECPGCGGSTTRDMGYPKIEIAQVYDCYMSKTFNPNSHKIQEKRFGDFWRTIQAEASKATN